MDFMLVKHLHENRQFASRFQPENPHFILNVRVVNLLPTQPDVPVPNAVKLVVSGIHLTAYHLDQVSIGVIELGYVFLIQVTQPLQLEMHLLLLLLLHYFLKHLFIHNDDIYLNCS
jgi:hypothetical protein